MLNISEIVASWPKDEYGWSISPGVEWCAEGNRVVVGRGARVGNYASVGDGARVGNYASVGDGARVGNYASVGDGARVGDDASVGDGARVGDYASVGNYARVGDDASVGDGASSILADLGAEQGRGYGRAAYIAADGAVRISAGCRDFSIAEARAHWGATDYPDRKRGDEYLALVDYVEKLSEINGVRK